MGWLKVSTVWLLIQGVSSPLAGQMVFRMTLFSAFGSSKRWLSTNADGSTRPLVTSDFYKVATPDVVRF